MHDEYEWLFPIHRHQEIPVILCIRHKACRWQKAQKQFLGLTHLDDFISVSGWTTGPGTAKSSLPPLLNMCIAMSKILLLVLHAQDPRKFNESKTATKFFFFVFSPRSLSYRPSSS